MSSIDIYLNALDLVPTATFYGNMLWMAVAMATFGLALAPVFQVLDLLFQGRTVELNEIWRRADNAQEIDFLDRIEAAGNRYTEEYLAYLERGREANPGHQQIYPNVEWITPDATDLVEPKHIDTPVQAVEENVQAELIEESKEQEEWASEVAWHIRGLRALDNVLKDSDLVDISPWKSMNNYLRIV